MSVESFLLAVHCAVRRTIRRPALFWSAVPPLAFGMAFALAAFRLVDVLLVHPLPFHDLRRLVLISPSGDGDRMARSSQLSRPMSSDSLEVIRATGAFDEIAAWHSSSFILSAPTIDVVTGWYVSSTFLRVLGVAPASGRAFSAEEDLEYSDAVIISDRCWRQRFASRADVLGQKAIMALAPGEGESKTIVGVLPAGVRLWDPSPDFLLPMGLRAAIPGHRPAHFVIGRLKQDVSLAAARQSVTAALQGLPAASPSAGTRLEPLADLVTGGVAEPLLLALVISSLLLLISAANVTGVWVADLRSRSSELQIELSLGATTRVLVARLLAESAVIVTAAAALSLFCASILSRTLIATIPYAAHFDREFTLNGRAIVFLAGCSGLAFMMLGGATYAAVRWTTLRTAPLCSDRVAGGTSRTQAGIIFGEIVIATILVVCATLFGRTLLGIYARPLGFDPSGIVVATIRVTQSPAIQTQGAAPIASSWIHTTSLMDALRSLPGVEGVAGAAGSPLSGKWRHISVRPVESAPSETHEVQLNTVTEGYFATLRIPIVAGRSLTSADRPNVFGNAPRYAVVSQEVERSLLGCRAVGRRLVYQPPGANPAFMYEVVGVAADTRQEGFVQSNSLVIYILNSTFSTINDILIRLRGGNDVVTTEGVRDAIVHFDPSVVVSSMSSLEAVLSESISAERFRAFLSSLCAIGALLLAASGMHGLGMHDVALRKKEIAIRVAMGATDREIVRLVLGRAAAITSAAGIVGCLIAHWIASLASSLMFGVSTSNVTLYALVACAIGIVTLSAMWTPAVSALRTNPAQLLRE